MLSIIMIWIYCKAISDYMMSNQDTVAIFDLKSSLNANILDLNKKKKDMSSLKLGIFIR